MNRTQRVPFIRGFLMVTHFIRLFRQLLRHVAGFDVALHSHNTCLGSTGFVAGQFRDTLLLALMMRSS